jgi:hypothetical protein
MRKLLAVSGLLVVGSCAEVTAADSAPVQVVLTPVNGSAACVTANPEPASVRVNQGIAFVNNSSIQITIVLVEEGNDEDVPLVSVAAGSTSGAVKFSSAGLREYYSQACGSGLGVRHTLAVTIN